jgi:hypothetical protein
MTEYNALRCFDAADAGAEIRLPVAYSHGGFAQMRHLAVQANPNPLGPLPVPEPGGLDALSVPAPMTDAAGPCASQECSLQTLADSAWRFMRAF